MELEKLSDEQLLIQTLQFVKDESNNTLIVIHHLAEIDRRRLYCDLGYGSLFEYCIDHLKYSGRQAQRRIVTSRLLNDLPQLEILIEESEIYLSVAAQLGSFFQKEDRERYKNKNPRLSDVEKMEVVEMVSKKSSRETEKILLALRPEKEPPALTKQVSPNRKLIQLCIDNELYKKIKKIHGLFAHKGNLTLEELFEKIIDYALVYLDPAKSRRRGSRNREDQKDDQKNDQKNDQSISDDSSHGEKKRSRYISSETRRQVWINAEGKCQYVSEETGKRCNSVYALEVDHIKPYSQGGASDINNLRLLCRNHNQRHGIKTLGKQKMEKFL